MLQHQVIKKLKKNRNVSNCGKSPSSKTQDYILPLIKSPKTELKEEKREITRNRWNRMLGRSNLPEIIKSPSMLSPGRPMHEST